MTGRSDRIETALRVLAPAASDRDIADILEHARFSKGLRTASPQTAAWLSLVAVARHRHTDYDDLLAEGYGVEAARHFCRRQLDEVLAAWGVRRRIGAED